MSGGLEQELQNSRYWFYLSALLEISSVLGDARADDAEKIRTIARILRTAGMKIGEPAAHEEQTGSHQARQA